MSGRKDLNVIFGSWAENKDAAAAFQNSRHVQKNENA
jgi:hypothetical protein